MEKTHLIINKDLHYKIKQRAIKNDKFLEQETEDLLKKALETEGEISGEHKKSFT